MHMFGRPLKLGHHGSPPLRVAVRSEDPCKEGHTAAHTSRACFRNGWGLWSRGAAFFCAHLLITWLGILPGDSTIGRPKQLGHSRRPCGDSHMGDIGDSTPLLFLPCLIHLRDSTRGGVGGVEHSLGCVTAYDTTAVAAHGVSCRVCGHWRC